MSSDSIDVQEVLSTEIINSENCYDLFDMILLNVVCINWASDAQTTRTQAFTVFDKHHQRGRCQFLEFQILEPSNPRKSNPQFLELQMIEK